MPPSPDSRPDIAARYEAGQHSDYRGPPPASTPADEELFEAHPRLLHESRYLAANSTTAIAVFDSRVGNGIGRGLSYEPQVKKRDGSLHAEFNTAVRKWHAGWSKQRVDVRQRLTIPQIERLAWRLWDTDGEVFLRSVVSPRFGGIPYRLQLLESDDVPYGFYSAADERIFTGIELDEWGGPVTYYIDPSPGSGYRGYLTRTEDMIPIPARNMRHLYHEKRGHQSRGVPLLHGAILRLIDTSDYEQSHRLAARMSERLVASVNRSPDWTADTNTGEEGAQQDASRWQVEDLEILDNLMAGESINFHTPQHPNQLAVDFTNMERRQIAAGTRSAFSQIAMIFDRSYAAQRLEMAFVWRLIESDRDHFVSEVAVPALYERPLEWALSLGMLNPPSDVDRDTLLDVQVDGPTMPVISPNEDREAFRTDEEMGWDSRSGIIRKLGRRPSDVYNQREIDAAESAAAAMSPPNRPGQP